MSNSVGTSTGLLRQAVAPSRRGSPPFGPADVAGQDDDGQVGVPGVGPEGAEGLQPAHDRHHQVHEDQVGPGPLDLVEGVAPVLGGADVQARAAEEAMQERPRRLVVLDHQDVAAEPRGVARRGGGSGRPGPAARHDPGRG